MDKSESKRTDINYRIKKAYNIYYTKSDKCQKTRPVIIRELLNNVNKQFGTSCWKIPNLDIEESKARIGLRECLQHGVIRSLGIVEQSKGDIFLLKCTIAMNDNSVYKLTGDKYTSINTHEKLDDDLNKILQQPKQFNKRSDYLDI